MTPLGTGKSAIQTDCHTNQSFLTEEGPFGDQEMSYKVIVILSGVILSGEPCNTTINSVQ